MIRYDKQFEQKMNRVVRSFNAKIRRLEKQGIKHLPSTVTVQELKTNYFERDALKRKLRQLERFKNKGAEEMINLGNGAKVTKWELEVLRSDMNYLKKRYTTDIRTYGGIKPTVLGVKQVATYAQMGDPKYENLRVMRKSLDKDLSSLDQSDFNRFKRKVGSQISHYHKQKYVFWANYFTFLDDVAYKADIDEELLNRVKRKLTNININDFMKLYEKEEAVLDLIDYYEIQKVRAGGFRKYKDSAGHEIDEVSNIEKIFKTLDMLIDDNSNVNFDMLEND